MQKFIMKHPYNHHNTIKNLHFLLTSYCFVIMALKYIPKDGLAGLKENWQNDLNAGVLVSFLALPLCLGIASASKFPPITGVFTAIIGGMIVALLSGSRLTIKGPAAGLIAIALSAVESLGYEKALATIVIASIIQVIFGLLKAGKLGNFFPVSVIHGMLAAIGVIIFSKQIHPLLGVKPTAKEPFELLAEIPHSIMHAKWEVALIGILGLIIIFTIPVIKNQIIKKIPAPMIVLLVAVPLSMFFSLGDFVKDGKSTYLVNIPTSILEGIFTFDTQKIGITFPYFSDILSSNSLQYILMFSLIGSIESLLTVKAIDGLDPYQRKSDMNKDLVAVGIGNTLAGLIGGLPMISEVARSSANVANGAKTRWANFFHGVALLIFVLVLAKVIVLIPMSALAAMLIAVAYRLASPKEFKHTYHVGKEQLLIFLTTLIITLATDLLIGVGAGILMKLIIEIYYGTPIKGLFKAHVKVEEDSQHNTIHFKISNSAIFSNYLGFKKYLDKLPRGKHVIIDVNEARLIDHTFMENLHQFELDYHHQGGSVEIQGMEHQNPVSDHPLAMRVFDAEYKDKAKNIVLDNRQKELEALTIENDMGFRPLPISDNFKYLNFKFFQGKKINYRANRLIKTIDHTRFEFSDMDISEMSSIGGRNYKMTVLTITDVIGHIPFFVLEKENALNKVTQGSQDIDFDEYQTFSNHYMLTSTEPEETKKFFTPNIIRYLEGFAGKDFKLRSRDSRLLIFKNEQILQKNDIKDLLDMAVGLVDVIKKEYLITV
ncbi:MAG: SulP family inorganic anion transporter [Raineya sp.]|nr:SulP family inorganic anion transporter [Raineya sp.]